MRFAPVLLAVACTARPPAADDPAPPSADTGAPDEPAPARPAEAPPVAPTDTQPVAPTEAPAPAADLSRAASLLGRPRSDVAAAFGPPGPGADGWARHGALAVRYRDGRCVGLQRQVPEDMDCQTAVESLGFRPVGFPLRRADGCEWPGISERHRLAPGVAGRYDAATRRLEVWLRDG